MFRSLFAIVCVLSLPSLVCAQISNADLEKKVRVVMEAHCFKCHSHQANKDRGKLMLDSRAAMLKGGITAPAIVPGHPEKSLLIKAVLHEDEVAVMVVPAAVASVLLGFDVIAPVDLHERHAMFDQPACQ